MMIMKPVSKEFICQAFGIGEPPVELYKNPEQQALKAGLSAERTIEAALWLPYAAKVYKLSPDIKDYVLVPVPVMITNMPNTNGDSVTIQEFLRFDPRLGQQAFKTFRGKPCHLEHANQVIENAKGVILDVFLRPMPKFGQGKYYKLVELMAYDRSKDPLLVNSILTGENNAYSVGFYFKGYSCSICGARVGQGTAGKPCGHTFPRKPTYRMDDGQLAYRQCTDIEGFETSVVANPSYVSAVGPHIMDASSVA
jgi:hypothetical protein